MAPSDEPRGRSLATQQALALLGMLSLDEIPAAVSLAFVSILERLDELERAVEALCRR